MVRYNKCTWICITFWLYCYCIIHWRINLKYVYGIFMTFVPVKINRCKDIAHITHIWLALTMLPWNWSQFFVFWGPCKGFLFLEVGRSYSLGARRSTDRTLSTEYDRNPSSHSGAREPQMCSAIHCRRTDGIYKLFCVFRGLKTCNYEQISRSATFHNLNTFSCIMRN
jgi:hypothetical protein